MTTSQWLGAGKSSQNCRWFRLETLNGLLGGDMSKNHDCFFPGEQFSMGFLWCFLLESSGTTQRIHGRNTCRIYMPSRSTCSLSVQLTHYDPLRAAAGRLCQVLAEEQGFPRWLLWPPSHHVSVHKGGPCMVYWLKTAKGRHSPKWHRSWYSGYSSWLISWYTWRFWQLAMDDSSRRNLREPVLVSKAAPSGVSSNQGARKNSSWTPCVPL